MGKGREWLVTEKMCVGRERESGSSCRDCRDKTSHRVKRREKGSAREKGNLRQRKKVVVVFYIGGPMCKCFGRDGEDPSQCQVSCDKLVRGSERMADTMNTLA